MSLILISEDFLPYSKNDIFIPLRDSSHIISFGVARELWSECREVSFGVCILTLVESGVGQKAECDAKLMPRQSSSFGSSVEPSLIIRCPSGLVISREILSRKAAFPIEFRSNSQPNSLKNFKLVY